MTLLEMSISSAMIILIVVVIRALFLYKLPKKIFVILWGIVLCKLFLPFSFASEYSIYTLLSRVSMLTEKTSLVAGRSIAAPSNFLNEFSAGFVFAKLPITLVLSFNWLKLVWFLGAVVTALTFLIPHIRFCYGNKTATPVKDDILNALIEKYHIKRRIQVKQSENIKIPVTYGILKPIILLPKSLESSNEEQLKFVFLHELNHIRHFDVLLKWFLFAAVSIHWFNPFVWLMYILANRDIELSCDEMVLRTMGGDFSKTSYAMTLISLEEYKLKENPIGNCLCKNAIEERIIAIMKIPKITVLSVVMAFVFVFGITTVSVAISATNEDLLTTEAKETGTDYPVNEQGQTYGHGPYLSGTVQEPDLILAEGENGVVGYVKAADMAPTFFSPEEAMAYQESVKAAGGYTLIPLYKSDGKTVIGKFRLYLNYSIPD